MNNLIVRSLSGLFFIAIVIGSILIGGYTFALTFALITGLAVHEFQSITNKQTDVKVNSILSALGGVLLFLSAFFNAASILDKELYFFYGLYIAILVIAQLFLNKSNPIHNWAYLILGQVIIALPFALLNYILYIHPSPPILILAVFITIWVNDTAAYLVGSSIGKHRLFERISPKKSWEGAVGGAVGVLISAYIFHHISPEFNLLKWILFSEIIVIIGTLGDLTESLLKRTLNIKDSGKIIPGHGGILDRFDSMLLAAPIIYILLHFLFV